MNDKKSTARLDLHSILYKLPQTGTLAYGMECPADDDRYCDIQTLEEIKELLKVAGIEYEDTPYCNGIRFTFEQDRRWNVFVVPIRNHEAMRMTTRFFCDLVAEWPAAKHWLTKKKENRYMLFRAVMAILETIE